MGKLEEKVKEENSLFTDILAKYALSLLFVMDIEVHKIQRISRR